MSKRRMIDPSFWLSETIANLNNDQRFLFIGLFSNADDQGRLRSHPALIRNMVFPYDSPDIDKIKSDLEAIAQNDLILIYNANGTDYIQILGWWTEGPCQQKMQWAYPSDIPAPDGWEDRLRYRQGNEVITHNWNGELDNYDDDSNPPRDNPPDDTPPVSGNGLPKEIGNLLPDAIGNATELELELDKINDDEERARIKTHIVQTVYQNNIHLSLSPIIAQEMTSEPYFNLPCFWWLEAMKIAGDNNIRKWSYVRGILDRSIQAGLSPMTIGPPQGNGRYQTRYNKNGATNATYQNGAKQNKRKPGAKPEIDHEQFKEQLQNL